jgi:hypothetical protein
MKDQKAIRKSKRKRMYGALQKYRGCPDIKNMRITTALKIEELAKKKKRTITQADIDAMTRAQLE